MMRSMLPEIFEDREWQMSLGERAAVQGVLSGLNPHLAIEIGSMEGACLRRIAAHAGEVHSFDIRPPSLPMPDNVVLHTGSSHEVLPPFLGSLEERERNVDFVMLDGDHSAEGVRRDVEDLLNSRSLARSVILIHDTANQTVRRGLDAVRFAAWPKVAYVDLDWIPGRVFAEPALRNEVWYGLGLVTVDSTQLAYDQGTIHEQRYRPSAPLLAQVRDLVLARERVPAAAQTVDSDDVWARDRIAILEAELGSTVAIRERAAIFEAELAAARRRVEALETQLSAMRERAAALNDEIAMIRLRYDGSERALEDIKGSASWRMTEPLRSAKRLVRPRPR